MGDSAGKSYAYRSYFDNTLSFSKEAKNQSLKYHGFIRDTNGEFDNVAKSRSSNKNEGFKESVLVTDLSLSEDSSEINSSASVSSVHDTSRSNNRQTLSKKSPVDQRSVKTSNLGREKQEREKCFQQLCFGCLFLCFSSG